MSTIEAPRTGTAAEVELKLRPNPLFTIVAIAAMIIGAFSALGGIAGGIYTYQTAAVENITTPDDAVFAGVPVRGPLSLWAQADIITQHQLSRTDGLRYAEMDRMIPQLDEAGQVMVDQAGDPIMVENTARLSWIDATSLTTVLALGILSYAFSAFAFVMGLTLIGLGLVVYKLRNSTLNLT